MIRLFDPIDWKVPLRESDRMEILSMRPVSGRQAKDLRLVPGDPLMTRLLRSRNKARSIGLMICMLPAVPLLMAADSRTLFLNPDVVKPAAFAGEQTPKKTVTPAADSKREGKMRRASKAMKPSSGGVVLGGGRNSTVTIKAQQDGDEGSTESDAGAPQVQVAPSMERFDAMPLRGWTLLHDGKFDPLTESVYDTLETERVLGIGQSEDPQSFESGVIDIQATLTRLANRYPDGIEGYVELDWEEPFFDVLHHGPSHPKYHATLENVTALVRRFKEVFPNTLVTHYNLPSIPYWSRNSDGRMVCWDKIDDGPRAEIFEDLEAMRPLLDEMDWFAPRYYDFVPTEQIPEDERDAQVASECEHRAAIVRWLRSYIDESDRPERKIIPVTRTNWVGGATAYNDWVEMEIPVEEYVAEQVMPALRNGADGIKIWQGWEVWMLHLAFIPPDTISDELLAKSHEHLRRLGILGENEIPDWTSAEQKRVFEKALGNRQMPYVSATASAMRSGLISPVVHRHLDGDGDSDESGHHPDQP